MDYEKQFQDDLEKAQALSLETLALEKFKAQRRKQLSQQDSHVVNTPVIHSTGNETEPPTRPERTNMKSRPRPGSLNSSPAGSIIAPPPSTQRRSSSVGLPAQDTPTPTESDLISFTSPTATSNAHANLLQFCEQIHKLNKPPDTTIEQQRVVRLNRSNSSAAAYQLPKQLLNSSSLTKFPTDQSTSNPVNYQMNNNTFPFNIPSYTTPLTAYVPPSTNPNYGMNIPVIGWNVFTSPENNTAFVKSQLNAFPNANNYPTNRLASNVGSSMYSLQNTPTNNNFQVGFSASNIENSINIVAKRECSQQSSALACIPKIPPLPSNYNLKPQELSKVYNDLTDSNHSLIDQPMFKTIDKLHNTNLIDLQAFNNGHDKKCVRVSVLEAFDPLLMGSSSSSYDVRGAAEMAGITRDDSISECSGSMYEEFDPFDYMYSGSTGSVVEPIYASVNKIDKTNPPLSPSGPPPLPPRNSAAWSTIERRRASLDKRKNRKSRLNENVSVVKRRAALHDCDLQAFHAMVKELRSEYVYTDTATNVGHIVSAVMDSQYKEGTSIKLMVFAALPSMNIQENDESAPVSFTCDVCCSVEHVILHVVCALEGEIRRDVSEYMLKVWRLAEFLSPGTCLSDYEYVHQCIKLEQDVKLTLLPKELVPRPLLRTAQDDVRDAQLSLEDILPNEPVSALSYDDLCTMLEILETEMERVEAAAARLTAGTGSVLQSNQVMQSVNAVCTYMGEVETLEITDAMQAFYSTCAQAQQNTMESVTGSKAEVISEDGDYSVVTLRSRNIADAISMQCSRIRDAVQGLIETYCHAFRVDFQLNNKSDVPSSTVKMTEVQDTVLVNLGALHRIPMCWKHQDYIVVAQIYHGTRPISKQVSSQPIPLTQGFCTIHPRVLFNSWLNFEGINVCALPRESRIVFTLFGRTLIPADDAKDEIRMQEIELGWAAIQFYNYQRFLSQGTYLLSLWPVTTNKRIGPAPAPGTHPFGDKHPVLGIEIPEYGGCVVFPESLAEPSQIAQCDFQSLDLNTQHELLEITEWDAFSRPPAERREILWEKRHYLVHLPCALPKVLLAAHSWDWACLADLHAMLHAWTPMPPHHALQLLMACPKDIKNTDILCSHCADQRQNSPSSGASASKVGIPYLQTKTRTDMAKLRPFLESALQIYPRPGLTSKTPDHFVCWEVFPDIEVRRKAVQWLDGLRPDELVDYLPQLVQALKYETYETSPLARFLLQRSLSSPRFAHHLYWLLTQNLPGQFPQNSNLEISACDDNSISEARYHRRFQLLLRSLLAISGEALQARFLAQQMLCKNLYEIAENLKRTTKESHRLKNLLTDLDNTHHMLQSTRTSLPLSPSLEVSGIQVRTCSYFPSNTLPLKINFLSADHGIIPAIFKVGDDLQQDMLTLQMMRVMDKLWLKDGLDLKMVTFVCVPTGPKRGMIEMVTNAETLRKIQVEWGLTGSFKDKPIAEWLAKHNPSELEYERAVTNFTASCAGYSVATYILGICDRHNDNIMLKTSGHLFHIDFGKFLGDAQMIGNFKRDRTPFVLTSDMAYVINGGDKPSARFHHFVDLCCQAFNIVRKHGNLVLHLFALMASSGIPGVTMDAVQYVQKALLLEQSNPEAAATFARMIESSLKSWFTQFNFFLHNLAQLRFSGDHGDGELLSFIPKTYTLQQEGRITAVQVYGFQKRYDPEKYYTYILKVARDGQPDPSFLFRSYREFSEFYQKLCVHFPLAKCHSLPSGMHVGRSNIKQVAQKRFNDIRVFLQSLFQKADEISHSDLVYTFFHPLLRDQQEADIHVQKCKETRPTRTDGYVRGQIKLSIQYHRGALTVMVHHVRSLPLVTGGQPPSTYVKVYLKPDPSKQTKRKTKVVKRNCHPSFMEALEYRLPMEIIQMRTLHATVWNHDTLQENEFLGGVELKLAEFDLTVEITEWFSLALISR